MGGNLDPVTSYFYKKKKSLSQEPIVLDESENEKNDVMNSGIFYWDGWRSDRMDKYYSENLTKLNYMVP